MNRTFLTVLGDSFPRLNKHYTSRSRPIPSVKSDLQVQNLFEIKRSNGYYNLCLLNVVMNYMCILFNYWLLSDIKLA